MDPLIALYLKAAVLMYVLVSPFALSYVPMDLTAVYVAGVVCGVACAAIDIVLGVLIVVGVVITAVTVSRAPKKRGASRQAEDPLMYACDVVATLPAPIVSPPQPPPAAVSSPPPAAVSSPPPPPAAVSSPPPPAAVSSPPPPPADDDDPPVVYTAPEEGGQRFLLRPDGFFVTDESLARAQSNEVGGDGSVGPLGESVYGVQGRLGGVSVVPMTW